MPIIYDEFLDDRELMQNNKAFQRQFSPVGDRTKLSYSNAMPTVLSKNNINLACSGNIDPEIREVKK